MTNKRILILISLLLFSFLLVGCNWLTPNQPPVITTDALPDATIGTAYTATVEATDADGDALAFSLVGPTDMVISEAGVISGWTPTEAGIEDVTVVVTDGTDSVSADFTITVSAVVVVLDSIVVLPEAMTLIVGGSETITSVTAHYDDESTAVIAIEECNFASSATGVATVSDAGLVTAVAEGTATITVGYEGMTDTLGVIVSEPVPDPVIELTGIVVNPKTMDLIEGEEETITSVTATYEIRGTEVPIALGDCTFSSDKEAVATVSDAGLVTAVAEGTATITVNYGGKSDTLEVTVTKFVLELIGIEVDPEDMTLYLGGVESGTKTIKSVTAHYNDGDEEVIYFDDYTIGVTPVGKVDIDEEVLTGLFTVTAKVLGTTTITITYKDMTDALEVEVLPFEVDHIVVDPKTMDIFEGGHEDITSVIAHYNDDTAEIVTDDCFYGSDNNSIAEVSTKGSVTGVAFGEATITVTYEGKTDTIEVTVKPILTSIVVDPKTMAIFEGKSEAIGSVTAYYSDDTFDDIALGSCTYVSDALEVTVSGYGVVMANAYIADIATITVNYTEEGITETDTIEVTVKPILSSITVVPEAMTLDVADGETAIDSVITAIYSDLSEVTLALTDCTYSIPAGEQVYATVTADTGLIFPLTDGIANITISYTEGDITVDATLTVTVTDLG